MPPVDEDNDCGGYRDLLAKSFLPFVKAEEKAGRLPRGGLAVLFDKNPMEAGGYAAVLANLADEPVYLTELYEDDADPPVRWWLLLLLLLLL